MRRGQPDALLPYKDACGDGRNSAIIVAKKKKSTAFSVCETDFRFAGCDFDVGFVE